MGGVGEKRLPRLSQQSEGENVGSQPAFLGSSPQFPSPSPCIKVKASEKPGKKQGHIGWRGQDWVG